MKELIALAAVALMLAGCAMQPAVNEEGIDPDLNQIEKNADQDLRNEKIQQQDRSCGLRRRALGACSVPHWPAPGK
ncbi:hypothetical protein [Comamonas sp. 26]|uniref:hypothetical protein n=1 Tax=Comamonas sp. 26 TaxID=2035201 RepID=UPI000C17D3E3|nr:hypothetical protein [Comamonas sp. 26]